MIRKLTAKGFSDGDWGCNAHPIMSTHVKDEVDYSNQLILWMDDKNVTSVLVDDGTTVTELHRRWVPADTTRNEVVKPEYYYKGGSTTYVAGQDPEVTCKTCGKTFLCDPMDAACRLCGEWFSEASIKKHGSNRKVTQDVTEGEK